MVLNESCIKVFVHNNQMQKKNIDLRKAVGGRSVDSKGEYSPGDSWLLRRQWARRKCREWCSVTLYTKRLINHSASSTSDRPWIRDQDHRRCNPDTSTRTKLKNSHIYPSIVGSVMRLSLSSLTNLKLPNVTEL